MDIDQETPGQCNVSIGNLIGIQKREKGKEERRREDGHSCKSEAWNQGKIVIWNCDLVEKGKL